MATTDTGMPMVIACPSCGTKNRVPVERVTEGRQAICGRCKTPLPLPSNSTSTSASASSSPRIVTDANFTTEVERSPMPVLLDLWAPWCGPCHALAPVVESLARELASEVRVGKLNVDENPAIATRFQVRGIPTLLIFKSGREVDRLVGVQPKSEIVRRLRAQLSS